MPVMKNPETGETLEMSAQELMEAMREGRVTVQQQVHHADGTVTSSAIFGNNVGDGIDRSLNIFATLNDVFMPALQMAQKIKAADENAEKLFRMDDSDVDYEATIDDTAMPVMHIITCTGESVRVARYIRDERKTVGTPTSELTLYFENGEISATVEQVQQNNLSLFAFGVHALRQTLRERGILQQLQDMGNRASGVVITAAGEELEARIVRGYARPDLPCLMFGGLFGQGMEDAVMMRPYMDELMVGVVDDEMPPEEVDWEPEEEANEEPVCAQCQEEAKAFMAEVLEKAPGVLKHLLMNSARDCMAAMAENPDIEVVTFEALCGERYILFDDNAVDWENAKDCFVIVSMEENESIFGTKDTQYVFNIVCKMAANDLDGYKTRMLEVCSALTEQVNGRALRNGKKLFYMLCQSQILSDQYGFTSLTFTDNDIYQSNEGRNPFARYSEDNQALFERLFAEAELQTLLGASGKTCREAYADGQLLLTEIFAENGKEENLARVILTWDFNLDASITLVPVAGDKRQLQSMVAVIKDCLQAVDLPGRGSTQYAERFSQEEVELSDTLTAALLLFQ